MVELILKKQDILHRSFRKEQKNGKMRKENLLRCQPTAHCATRNLLWTQIRTPSIVLNAVII